MKSLYRRYRPVKLEDVVGQPQVTEPLQNALREGKVAHAYLFIGPRGCGKTSVARILAHEINGFRYEIEDDYVDIVEIDGASNRGIDNIRELREKVAIAPSSGKYKVYIIDEVHMLTKEAFNALLKTLEEPPEHAIFIMATTDAYKVPVTITSRAQTFTFKLAPESVMVEHLRGICEKERIKITDDALEIVVKRGGGSFRDSLSLLDQISTLNSEQITKELVISALGLPDGDKITELLNAYREGDVVKITTLLKDLLITGIKPETLAEGLIGAIIEAPKAELMTLLGKLPEVKAPFAEAKILVALMSASPAAINRPVVQNPTQNKTISTPAVPMRQARPTTTTMAATPMTTATTPSSAEPAPPVAITAPPATSPQDFSWAKFVEDVTRLNDGIASQLKSVDYAVNGNTLDIYPLKKITRTILSRDNNKNILAEAAHGLKIVVHELDDNPNIKKDELILKMSAIMGGEVQNDGGDNPF